MTFVEPFQGLRRGMPRAERGFRFAFLVLYALLVAVSILLLGEISGRESRALAPDTVRSLCALMGLTACAFAILFRMRNPLPQANGVTASRRPTTSDEERLAMRIIGILRDERLYASANFKLADLARRLSEPEYKVSRSITAVLAFANFNRLINHHRIECAKGMLSAPGSDTPILLIAFDCGFASLGPFNRAFKDATGVTPRVFRNLARTPDCSQALKRLDRGALQS
jgi:AraC-like DNA-binding protein